MLDSHCSLYCVESKREESVGRRISDLQRLGIILVTGVEM
jgi:hypothetical protein